MKNFPYMLALRYIRGASHKKSISTMIGISYIGIMIGAYGLMLTLAIMNGFETATYEQLQGIHAQVIIRAFGNPINIPSLTQVLQKEFPEVSAFSPYAIQQVMIQNPHTNDISTIVAIKGIEPESHTLVNNLSRKLIAATNAPPTLDQTVTDNRILIGQNLAETLDLAIGDSVTLLFAPDEPRRKKINLSQKKVSVGGFFKTGIEEFDSNLIFSSLTLLNKLFPNTGVTHVQLKLTPGTDEKSLIERLKKRLELEVYSWKEMYPALVSALKLEKYVMCCILILISLIASMNIISLIFMQIYQKRADVAILRAMGMTVAGIHRIFLYIGGIIAACASLTGIVLALITCFFIKKYPFISLPDAYLISYLPVSWEWYMPLLIFFITMLLCIPAILIPLRRTEQIDITHILKFNA
jgi:lipoprotein-releasing system permease protein